MEKDHLHHCTIRLISTQDLFNYIFYSVTLKKINFILFHMLIFSCPDSKIKPLGPMLLNGLTKLINEYKEVS